MFSEIVDGTDLRDKIIVRINNFDSTKPARDLEEFILTEFGSSFVVSSTTLWARSPEASFTKTCTAWH